MTNYTYVPLIPHASSKTYGLVSYDDVQKLDPVKVGPHSHSAMTIPISPLWHTNNMDVYQGQIFLFPDLNEDIHSAWDNKRWYTSNSFNIVLNSNASFVLQRYPYVGSSMSPQSGMNPQKTMFTRFLTQSNKNCQVDVTITFFQDDVGGRTPVLNLNQGDISSGWYPLTSNTSTALYSLTGSSTPNSSRTLVLRWSGVWAQWQVIFDSGGWRPVPGYMVPSSAVGGKYCRLTLDPAAIVGNGASATNNWINTTYSMGGLNVRKYVYNRGFTVQINYGQGSDWMGTVLADGAGAQAFSSFTTTFDGAGGGTTVDATPSAAYIDIVSTGVIDALYHEVGHYLNQTYLKNNGQNADIVSDSVISECHRTAIKTSLPTPPAGQTLFLDTAGHFYGQSEWIAQAIGTWILQKGINDGSATAGMTSFTYVLEPMTVFGSTVNMNAFYARMDALCPDLV
jgi:hypothetical protein